ncbi:regulator of microtubule dynamics protein 3-like [Onthophagus taurus]|uniref:regulator of microtubule dynamics protein 3-like n=1 Tax=Onthophagus taurus TaxID=166361 RepID=UPI000C20963D|nr:regulator of microtubule dynamics protein 3-like [Onthophagus taurus]
MSSTPNQLYIIGAGLVGIMGAVSIILYEHFRQERRSRAMAQNLNRIDAQITNMREELERMRKSQKAKRNHFSTKPTISSAKSYTISDTEDYKSPSDTSDQEFFDISDEEVDGLVREPKELTLIDIDKRLGTDDTEIILETLTILDNLCGKYPNDPQFWYRLAKCCHAAAVHSVQPQTKRENISKGVNACNRALNFEPNNPEVHKLYAILVGLRSDFEPTKQRIADGFLFKQHVDIAIKLNPTDASLHHMLGRFKYEIAGLKWFERKVATALFGEPPNGTYDEALNCFLEAERLTSSDWKENKMYIGKCYIALGDIHRGIDWLQQAIDIVSGSQMEELSLNSEIGRLLNQYNVYR